MEYAISQVLNSGNPQHLVDFLNQGWKIERADSNSSMIIYILSRIIPQEAGEINEVSRGVSSVPLSDTNLKENE